MSSHYFGQFIARDKQGNEYIIHIYQTTVEINARSGSFEAPTGWELKTADGRTVNKQMDGTYTIAEFPEITLTSDDPRAF